MPGLCAIFDSSKSNGLDDHLQSMLRTLRYHPWYVEHAHVDSAVGLAMGRISLGYVNAAPQPAKNETGTVLAVMDGELYDAAEARRRLEDEGHRFSSDSHAEILVHGYEQGGADYFREFHGSFSVVLWDAERQKLILANDRFGMHPLYYTHLPGRLLAASRIQSLLLDSRVGHEPNWRGIAQFFSYGQYLCEDTSYADVKILPAAAWATYDTRSDQLTIDRYYQLTDDYLHTIPSDAAILDGIDTLLGRAVERRLQETDKIGLALSGGLDARTILACVDMQQVPLKTISYGIHGSLDHHCAESMAAEMQCEHVNHVLDANFLSNYRSHLDTMVSMTDGQYLSQCIILPTLPIYRQLGLQVLLRGHAGELVHMYKAYAYSIDQKAMEIRTDEQLESWLTNHLQAYMLSAVDGRLFRGKTTEEIEELANDSLRESLAHAAPIDEPLQRIWHLFISQRLRRETSLSLAKFGSMVEVRVPYLDNDLIPLLLSAPPYLKQDETIQSHILRNRKPSFLNIVNANTGTRVGAGPWSRRLSSLRLRVLAKLGVPGYQPYERLGLWLRRELAPMVREILLSEQCLDRGVFEPDTVQTIITQHEKKQHNHTYLLMAMMIYELGQQRLSDPGLTKGLQETSPHPTTPAK